MLGFRLFDCSSAGLRIWQSSGFGCGFSLWGLSGLGSVWGSVLKGCVWFQARVSRISRVWAWSWVQCLEFGFGGVVY